jgi:hypothetical protein
MAIADVCTTRSGSPPNASHTPPAPSMAPLYALFNIGSGEKERTIDDRSNLD